MTYCSIEDTSAKLTYTKGNGEVKSVIFKGSLPIEVTVTAVDKEKFQFTGNAPLNHFAPGNIRSISCTGTFRQIGNDPSTELPCTYIVDRSVVTGNRVQAEFDSVYSDNTGDMTFVVDYDANYDVIRVLHDDVLIYKDTGISPITFKVNCIRDRCPPGYCECKTDEYPGYCCSDCASNTKQIHDMRTALKVKNGG